ncbi:MAG: hypothetical protein JSS81_05900 [Acidobacteria bacterium]|nr:hypothetical protein [Acidobacteriota bacterium]
MQPGFLLSLVIALIGFISWLVKLERRNAALEKEVARLQTEKEKEHTEITREIREMRREIDLHQRNVDVHFNQKVSEQVDRRNEQRFQTIEGHINEIKSMLRQITEKD